MFLFFMVQGTNTYLVNIQYYLFLHRFELNKFIIMNAITFDRHAHIV